MTGRALVVALSSMATSVVHAQTTSDDFVWSTWIVLSFLLLFYATTIVSAYPYTRDRIPLLLFVLCAFFPPFFLMLLLYLFVLILTTPVVVVDDRRQATATRNDIRV